MSYWSRPRKAVTLAALCTNQKLYLQPKKTGTTFYLFFFDVKHIFFQRGQCIVTIDYCGNTAPYIIATVWERGRWLCSERANIRQPSDRTKACLWESAVCLLIVPCRRMTHTRLVSHVRGAPSQPGSFAWWHILLLQSLPADQSIKRLTI